MTQQTETDKAKVCFVKVPDDANNIRVFDYFTPKEDLWYDVDGITREINLPDGAWKFINTLKDITEEEAILIQGNLSGMDDTGGFCKVNHIKELKKLASSVNVFTENPYGEKKPFDYVRELKEINN